MAAARMNRRGFVGLSATAAASGAFGALAARHARGAEGGGGRGVGYGPLAPRGPELALPPGFTYDTISIQGRPMSDGFLTPHAMDGMGAFALANGNVALIRNHEDRQNPAHFRPGGPLAEQIHQNYGPRDVAYDPFGGGGCTILEVEPHGHRRVVQDRWAIVGNTVNCAGGITPWGSWITCEETTALASATGFAKAHGYAFDVPLSTLADGPDSPVALKFLGRFAHEALAVDPATNAIYETEDNGTNSGFYRWRPPAGFTPGQLDGLGVNAGVLEMMRVKDPANPGQRIALVNTGLTAGATFDVEWVPIANRDPGAGQSSVVSQGVAAGGSRFNRLEGIWYGDGGKMWFQSTSGGNAGRGQVFLYDIPSNKLILVFESPGAAVLDSPDNMCVSPSGGLVICEDGGGDQWLRGLTPDGEIFDLGTNILNGSEFAGACFSPDGQTLFVSIQGPTAVELSGGVPVPPEADELGRTYAIRGPWKAGPLG
jgi:secreted PhoX family phosphatase